MNDKCCCMNLNKWCCFSCPCEIQDTCCFVAELFVLAGFQNLLYFSTLKKWVITVSVRIRSKWKIHLVLKTLKLFHMAIFSVKLKNIPYFKPQLKAQISHGLSPHLTLWWKANEVSLVSQEIVAQSPCMTFCKANPSSVNTSTTLNHSQDYGYQFFLSTPLNP